MPDSKLTNPLFDIDRAMLENDLAFARKNGLHHVFTRRRFVFYMDGYRYAHDAAQKRWDIPFVFMETGREAIKKVYQSESLNADAARIWLHEMDRDGSFGEKLVRELEGVIATEKKLVEAIPLKPLTAAGIEESLRLHLAWWVQFFELAFLWFAVDSIKEAIDARVRSEWKGTPEECEMFLSHVYRPKKLPLSSVEQRELLALSRLGAEELGLALERHADRYKHLALHTIADEYFDIEYYRSRIHVLSDQAEYDAQKAALETADREIAEADRIHASRGIAPELKSRIEFVRWFMYLRTESIDHMMLVNGAYKPIFEQLASQFGLTLTSVLHMTYKEIIDSLHAGQLSIDPKLIEARTESGYAYFIGKDHSVLVAGEDVAVLEKLCGVQIEVKDVREIKGQVAFAGHVQGIVRVIADRRHANELQDGEILVTTMTSPEFVPAMKRAAGIITNEGGILCHAAIMSRELRKPCIIGTKVATDMLRNGDMVELDAESGVRILNRSAA